MIVHSLISTIALMQSAAPDQWLDQARNPATQGPIYSYVMNYEEGEIKAAGRVDPSKRVGQRIIVSSPPEETWTDDFRSEISSMEDDAADIWCAEFSEAIPVNAKLDRQDDTSATYSFKPVPDPDDKDDAKFMKHISGSVTIAKEDGAILHFSMTAPKPFKPVMIAKIQNFDLAATCARAPDGRTYIADMRINIKGKAMMQKFEESMHQTISDLVVVE
ncbi:MAG: hypothetical protein V3V30_00415 [Parvularculaceae bacterium]